MFGQWVEFGFEPEAFWRQTPRLVVAAFEAKARAAETARKLDKWRAWVAADIIRHAYHQPNKMPSLAKFLGDEPAGQTGEQRRSLMKGFVAGRGGKIRKRSQP